MKILRVRNIWLAVVFASTIGSAKSGSSGDSPINTTSSAIAIANLDQQIRQAADEFGRDF